MRKTLIVLVAAMMVGMTVPAFAELQNVQVGGSIRIRGNWVASQTTDNDSPDSLAVEQRTKVNVSADFTDDVHAFIELDSYHIFGDGFRGLEVAGGNYALSGHDLSGDSGTSVNLNQAYIEMRESWGYPITIKIGRSEFADAGEFLIGNNDTSSNFRGLYFDGVWGSYNNENFNVGAFWTRPYTNGTWSALTAPGIAAESSGDINFAGIHGAYTGIENMSIGGFYYYYNGQSIIGDAAPDAQQLHTFGVNFSGNRSQFDWAAAFAYQTGDSPTPGVDTSDFAVDAALGYTFDVNMQPRIFVNGAYYGGGDDDGTELAFNRLFSDKEYSEFIDNTSLTNFWNIGGGVSAQVTEKINLKGLVNYYQDVEDFGASDDDLGIEIEIIGRYNYSEDLYFELGYAHLFTGDSPNVAPGDDLDYVYVETGIKF